MAVAEAAGGVPAAPGAGGTDPDHAFLSERGLHPPARSLYLHVPFCFHKCHYCDFYSIVDTQDRQEAFTDRLIREFWALAPHARLPGSGGEGGGGRAPLRTIFVGGGTPSLLRVDLWERLLDALDNAFDLSLMGPERSPGGERGEFTVECNPETVTPELMAVLAAGGVNRVSVGAQSFEARHLKTLERWHDPENVSRALGLARAAGIDRQSVDLIFGVPGQTLDDWGRDLDRALSLGTTHLSCYGLTYEPGTAMTARLRAGKVRAIDEDLEADLFEATLVRLRGAGLERYEVSNFARPGDESRHNIAYWRQEQWLAAGPSASGHLYAGADPAGGDGGWRWKNVPRLGDYLAGGSPGGLAPLAEREAPDPARAVRERIMTGLRLTEGVDAWAVREMVRRASLRSTSGLESAVRRAVEKAWLTETEGRWRLTDAGFMVADLVAGEVMGEIG